MDINQHVFDEALSKSPSSIQYSARTLFNVLDSKLDPQISVIAVPFNKQLQTLVINTENSNLESIWFEKIRNILHEIPQYYLDNLAPDIQGVLWQDKVKIKQTIQKNLDKRGKNSEYRAFTSLPAFLHNYCVSIVLHLSRKALDSHYSLKRNSIRPFPLETSLIYETAVQFLYECLPSFRNFHLRDNGEEALRQAGYWLMQTTGKAAGRNPSESLFHVFNSISSLRYEGAEGSGKIIISRYNHPNVDIAIALRNPVSLDNYRGIRKLLEMTSSNIQLLCDSDRVYGIGKLNSKPYDESTESLFVIEFAGHHIWKLWHSENELMIVKFGKPRLPEKPISVDSFRSEAKKIFPHIKEDDLANLWDLAFQVSKQKHGTMIVVSDHAKKEAERLRNQSTPIRATPLTTELTLPLSSIDGAILVDTSATCHAIGVILDGIATERGNPARGARYNSAIRYSEYVKNQNHGCLIVVVSEDGMIDLI